MNQDKLGFYRVGDLKFYSKLEAIEMHTKTGIHPHWDFNEAAFGSYDWTVEPKESLLELYRQRAQQIRDQYDYVILSYSGGADSTTAMESFLYNDIKLDEVVSFLNYEAEGDRNGWFSAEIFRTAAPNIARLQEKYPWLKHRIVDLTQIELDFFSDRENKFNWIYEVNMSFSPNNVARESFALKIKEWADIINSGKKLCIVWGIDKPRVYHVDGKFLARFIDFIDVAVTVKSISGQQPYTDELFYWTPDLPKICIKQAHTIMNYLKGDVSTLMHVSHEKSDIAYRELNQKKYWLSHDGVHSLIYPGWNIDTFSCGKTPSIIFTNRDRWFFNLQEEHIVKKHWKTGLEKLWQILPDYWKTNPQDLSAGFKACWSRDYFLE